MWRAGANLDGTYQALVGQARLAIGATKHPNLPGVNVTGVALNTVSANTTYYLPIVATEACTLDELWIEVTSAGAGGTTARVAVYNADTNWNPTTLVVAPAGTLAVDGTGVKKSTGIGQALTAGRYCLSIRSDGSPQCRNLLGSVPGGPLGTAFGASATIVAVSVSEAYGAFGANATAPTTAATGTTAFLYPVSCLLSAT